MGIKGSCDAVEPNSHEAGVKKASKRPYTRIIGILNKSRTK